MDTKQSIEPYQRPYRWVMLSFLCLLYFAHGTVTRSASPLVTPILKDLDMIYAQMGLVLGSWQLTYIAVAVFAGIIIDRWGARKAIFVGAAVIGLSTVWRYFAHGFTSLLAAVALFGLGGPMISIGVPKTVSVWFKGKERSSAVGIYWTAQRLGQICALAATNAVVMPLTGYSWRLTFVCFGAFTLIVALLWWLFARDPPAVKAAENLPVLQVLTNLIKVRKVRIVLLAGLLTFAILHGFSNWLPKILENGGLSPHIAGYAAALPLLASIPASILIPRLIPPRLRGCFLALTALLAVTAVLLVVTSSAWLLAGLLLYGLSGPTLLPLLILVLMELPEVESKYMGSAGGIFFCVSEIGGFLGPLVIGILADLTGSFLAGAFFLFILGLIILALTLTLKTVPRRPTPDKA